MSRQIQIRRGTVAQHETFTGAVGELTFDGETVRVHDGATPGGIILARADKITPSTPIPDNADYVIETWRSDDGSMWYRKYKSGWVEQGGIATISAQNVNVAYTTDVIFPIAMANTNYTVNTVFITDGGNTTGLRNQSNERHISFLRIWTFSTTGVSNSYQMSWEIKGFAEQ